MESDAIREGTPPLPPPPTSVSMRPCFKHGLIAGLLVFAVGSVLPIWTVWHIAGMGGTVKHGTLWQALGEVPHHFIHEQISISFFLRIHGSNLIYGAALIVIALLVAYATTTLSRLRTSKRSGERGHGEDLSNVDALR
jgi:hypothetical protein